MTDSSSDSLGSAHSYTATLRSRDSIRIHYLEHNPAPASSIKGTVLLLHGFPQSSHQFRHVLPLLSQNGGYRCIAPDLWGVAGSSPPPGSAAGFTKSSIAADVHALIVEHLQISDRIHVVGHDIGGMVAHAYASRYADEVASVTWGECPLPGTSSFDEDMGTIRQFHFAFQAVPDLPELLVTGRERLYLTHFFDKLVYNAAAIRAEDVDEYVRAYERPGAMRCAFATYAAFQLDKEENSRWLREQGKCKVPTLMLSGEHSDHAGVAEQMGGEMYKRVACAIVENAGHYIAEENPGMFAQKVLEFIDKHHGQ